MAKNTKATNNNELQLPSMLSFERKLETSDGLMYSGNWNDIPAFEELKITDEAEREEKIKERQKTQIKLWKKIEITPRFNRSTISAHNKKEDHIDKTKPNVASSGNDDATLLSDNDTLKLSFSLRVIGNLGQPYACNDFNFSKKIKEYVDEFQNNETQGLGTLAYRYAYNIANGRFLWRNRVCADDIVIHVFNDKDPKPLSFNAYDYSLKNFDKGSEYNNVKTLAAIIQKGFQSDGSFTFVKVDAYVKLGSNQHVFPSEEMNTNKKGKTLFQLNQGAAMHNVKIGNAIRTIDDWYTDEDILIKDGDKTDWINKKNSNEEKQTILKRPIAIEPYGSVTQQGCAYRATGEDLYTLIVSWVNGGQLKLGEINYVVANLIRGGVFSRAK